MMYILIWCCLLCLHNIIGLQTVSSFGRLFVLLWYVFGVLLMLNLVTAFFLNEFTNILAEMKSTGEVDTARIDTDLDDTTQRTVESMIETLVVKDSTPNTTERDVDSMHIVSLEDPVASPSRHTDSQDTPEHPHDHQRESLLQWLQGTILHLSALQTSALLLHYANKGTLGTTIYTLLYIHITAYILLHMAVCDRAYFSI